MQREINRRRSKVRARVEHVIGIINRIFGFAKVRYRGLVKSGNRLFVAAAVTNLFIVRRPLLDALRARCVYIGPIERQQGRPALTRHRFQAPKTRTCVRHA